MKDLYISNGTETELLTGLKEAKRKTELNSEISISLNVLHTEINTESYNLVETENTIELDGETYVIKQLKEHAYGKRSYKVVTAFHKMFDDLNSNYIYTKISGTQSFTACIDFLLSGTGYTYDLIDTIPNRFIGEIGDDTSLSLLDKVLSTFGVEYTISGTVFTFKTQIGVDSGFQFRYKYNTKTINKEVKTDQLSTYIKGFGSDGVTAEYTSPNSAIFGIKHAKPIRDERYTNASNLQEALERKIQDEPIINYEIEEIILKAAGYPYDVVGIGDTVYTIWEPLNYDFTARVYGYEEDLINENNSRVQLGSTRKTEPDRVIEERKRVEEENRQTNERVDDTNDKIDAVVDNGTVKYDALDQAVKDATEALQSAQTELEFNNGIIAREKTNANHLVLLNSAGIGVSTDGGSTFQTAMTAEGIVADRITTGLLRAERVEIGSGSTFLPGYDPTTKETPTGAQDKADAAENNAKGYADTNDTTLRTDLRLIAPLPTDLTFDANGITASASSGGYARLDYRGLYIYGGALQIDGGLSDDNISSADNWNTQGTYIDATGVYTGKIVANQIEGALFKVGLNTTTTNLELFTTDTGVHYIKSDRGGSSGFRIESTGSLSLKADSAYAIYTTNAPLAVQAGFRVDSGLSQFNTAVTVNALLTVNDLEVTQQSAHFEKGFTTDADVGIGGKLGFNNGNKLKSYTGVDVGSGLQCRNSADSAHVPIEASSFVQASKREYKENIENLDVNAVSLIESVPARQYIWKATQEAQIGFIQDEVPQEMIVGEGVNLYPAITFLWKAVQELSAEIKTLKGSA